MGFINEVLATTNDINSIYYGTNNLFTKLACKISMRRVKKMIGSLRNNEVTTKMISEYADYYIEVLKASSDSKNHIKQVLKGSYENACSITFEVPMPDEFVGTVTINFNDRYSTTGNYVYHIVGPNSSARYSIVEYNISNVYKKDNVNLDNIGKTSTEKQDQLKNLLIDVIYKDIKQLLLSNIEVKELQNG